MTSQEPTAFVFIVTGAFALLTFVLAFYALVARERRTPYMTTNTVYWTAFVALSALMLVFAGRLLEPLRKTLEWLAQAALLIALVIVIWRVFSLRNSHIYFRTDNAHKNLRPVRWIRRKLRSPRPTFEHAHVDVPAQVLDDLATVDGFPVDKLQKLRANELLDITHGSIGIAYRPTDFRSATKPVVDLAIRALSHGCYFQYTTAARNPVEVVRYLKASWPADRRAEWQEITEKIIVIDAFTSHFGFTDTVHEEAAREIEREGIVYVACPPSYAGIHTANSQAFNILKKAAAKKGREQRETGLIVYEGSYSLVDLESPEQYRIFVRHVLASERLWRGMISVFVDTAIPDEQWKLVTAYIDVEIPSSRNVEAHASQDS